MYIILNEEWADHITKLPESGMGYHIVDVHFLDGSELNNVCVLNSENMDWPDYMDINKVKDIVDITSTK